MKDESLKDLRIRTRAFAARIVKLCDALPNTRSANVIANQVLRSGTSVGAHYHEGKRSRSNAEVISKLEAALQELEETACWLALLADTGMVSVQMLAPLMKKADELTAILVTCVKGVKARR